MNKQDLDKLDKQVLINKYKELQNKYLNILATHSVLEARLEQEQEMNNMLVDKINKIRVLKK